MIKKIAKFIFTTLGVVILVSCITGQIDGVGRFAMILTGSIFSYIGSYIKA